MAFAKNLHDAVSSLFNRISKSGFCHPAVPKLAAWLRGKRYRILKVRQPKTAWLVIPWHPSWRTAAFSHICSRHNALFEHLAIIKQDPVYYAMRTRVVYSLPDRPPKPKVAQVVLQVAQQ